MHVGEVYVVSHVVKWGLGSRLISIVDTVSPDTNSRKSFQATEDNIEFLKTLTTNQVTLYLVSCVAAHLDSSGPSLLVQVAELLHQMNLPQYQEAFLKEQVTGGLLAQCTTEMLQTDLGVTKKIHCLRIHRLITGETSAAALLAC